MANFNKLPSNNEKNTYLYKKTHSTHPSKPSTSGGARGTTSKFSANDRYKLNYTTKNDSVNIASVLASFPPPNMRASDDIKKFKNYHRALNDVEPDIEPAIEEEMSSELLNTQTTDKSTAETEHRNNVDSVKKTSTPDEKPSTRHRTRESVGTQANIDPFAYLKRAAVQWEKRVRKSLQTMCASLKVNGRGHPRTKSDRQQVEAKWELLSNYSVDLANYRPVFAPKDLLEAVLGIHGPVPTSYNSLLDPPKWEFAHIALPSKTLKQLYTVFNDVLKQDLRDVPQLSRHAVNHKDPELCKRILRKGSATLAYRANLWTFSLGAQVSKDRYDEWKRLKAKVIDMDHVVDKLIFKDVQLTASNDDQYFVFEDVLYQVLLCFSRDVAVAEEINAESATTKIKAFEDIPCGIVPYYGISMYAAPFCYLYDNSEQLYFAFRQYYLQYCHKLTVISTDPQGIVSLCLQFERLLIAHEPELWSHFRDIEVNPLRIVFKWLMRSFCGHLPPDQLLVLYDLIIGFDNLEILPLFAIIILSFRKETLLQVKSFGAIDAILADFSSIKVLPLIRLALCSH